MCSANDVRRRQGLEPFYALTLLAARAGAVTTSCGLLHLRTATTHWCRMDELRGIDPGTTMLSQAHASDERAAAQPLMEWANSAMAALMSLSCGALVHTLGWQAINLAMLAVLALLAAGLWRGRRVAAGGLAA